jgi:hypothetical protein
MNRQTNRRMAACVFIIAVILSIFACNLPARELSGEELERRSRDREHIWQHSRWSMHIVVGIISEWGREA